MFMITVGKNGLKRAGAVVLCAAVLAGAAVIGRFAGTAAVTASAPVGVKVEGAQDVAGFFVGFGLEIDPAGVTADQVKIPRKWDDSFSAFNTVVTQSGLDLSKYKGRTVEKWLAPIPAKSTGDTQSYGVLLVYKKKPVGAYLLEKPSGAVSGLADAVQSQAWAENVPLEEDSLEVGLMAELVPDPDGYPVE